MKKAIIVVLCGVLPALVYAQNPFEDLQNAMGAMKKNIEQQNGTQIRTSQIPETKLKEPAIVTAAAKILSTGDELGKIPMSDGFDEKERPDEEAKNFAKNWKGRELIFRGKTTRGDPIKIDEYQIYGCEKLTKGMKPNTPIVVIGRLDSRERGGSSGEPLSIKNCALYEGNSLPSSSPAQSSEKNTPVISPAELKVLKSAYKKNVNSPKSYQGKSYQATGVLKAHEKGSSYIAYIDSNQIITHCVNIEQGIKIGVKQSIIGVLAGDVYTNDEGGESFYLKDCRPEGSIVGAPQGNQATVQSLEETILKFHKECKAALDKPKGNVGDIWAKEFNNETARGIKVLAFKKAFEDGAYEGFHFESSAKDVLKMFPEFRKMIKTSNGAVRLENNQDFGGKSALICR
jgi:hypothetical protein